MPPRRLTLPLLWLGLLLGLSRRPAAAQTTPPARPDSLVVEQLPADTLRPTKTDSLVVEPVTPVDSVRYAPPRIGPRDLSDYAYADSLTAALLARGRWAALDSAGRRALALGLDYPVLRQRLGYAAALRGRPAVAIGQYERARHANAADPLARLGLAYGWLALNQRETAAQLARPLPDSLRRALHLSPRAMARAEAEVGAQWPSSPDRSAASFVRLGVGSQLGGGWTLWQAASHYAQQVRVAVPDPYPDPRPGPYPEPVRPRWVPVRQFDYQALLTVPLPLHLQGRLGYHFTGSRFHETRYPGHLAYAALRYVRPYWQLQAGLYAGRLTDTSRTQTEVQLTILPLGNLRLYGFTRAAFVRSAGRTYPHVLVGAGARLASRLWAEGYAGWGRVPVLADQDGAYVYNLLDPLRRRLGLGLLVPLPGGHWQARLYYGAEARTQIQTLTFYTQHTLTLAATWTW
ncbi:tetratricopeptide repeat protein [Hymenobacter jeollabukensis]|uniref:Tetratricopeptide repeat protein n=1 Tax=Hymenobacter jeollabukensis TaxID=2025313 RepID=A0A5R8WWQ1_9BACT|nr:hypothetical protein [Hymenobacter jeollabukensis]TLM96951.1 hypothetical protein FDY95_02860 [Hymenobacter jeollabukensis]